MGGQESGAALGVAEGEEEEMSDIELFDSDSTHSFGGPWTTIKLEAVQSYLSAFNTALGDFLKESNDHERS